MEYILLRSKRKTIELSIRDNGIIVKAPLKMSKKDIDSFVFKHEEWIKTNQVKFEEKKALKNEIAPFQKDELDDLLKKAEEIIPKRIEYYEKIIGIRCNTVSYMAHLSHWGTCDKDHNIRINILLMAAPIEVIDSVVVHELCHLIVHNHSKKFYNLVYKYYPEYDKYDKWLKQNGNKYMAMIGY